MNSVRSWYWRALLCVREGDFVTQSIVASNAPSPLLWAPRRGGGGAWRPAGRNGFLAGWLARPHQDQPVIITCYVVATAASRGYARARARTYIDRPTDQRFSTTGRDGVCLNAVCAFGQGCAAFNGTCNLVSATGTSTYL